MSVHRYLDIGTLWNFSRPLTLTGETTGLQVQTELGDWIDAAASEQANAQVLLLYYDFVGADPVAWRIIGTPTGILNPGQILTPQSGDIRTTVINIVSAVLTGPRGFEFTTDNPMTKNGNLIGIEARGNSGNWLQPTLTIQNDVNIIELAFDEDITTYRAMRTNGIPTAYDEYPDLMIPVSLVIDP